ncbi:MAG TPA: LysR family transcriptional regulator [Cyclobacteriaceae bacterium]|nr:LysR family transcriptional regulator [Cyclobacteriaceae bacterium]HRJ81553.1 LysR family transcriptional regulator [Cyclobacteriaceae bacterium]
MNYTLHQLQIFLKVVQSGSVTKTAEEMHMTQPAVSIQLRNFQNQFDIPLTEVIGRKLYVTDFGKEIAETAENIINQVYTINYKTHAHKGQLAGRLKVSVVSTGKYVMPFFLTGFMKANPGVELLMDVTNKTKVIESLGSNQIDFALVSIIPEEFDVNKIDLMENTLYLVGNSETKVNRNISVRELFAQLPLIFREPGSGTRQAMERFIDRHHLKVRKKLELTSNEAVKQAVIAGLGYSIMPLIGIKNELYHGTLKLIQVKGLPIKTMWQLIWLKGKKLSPVPGALLQYIQQEKNEIIRMYFKDLEKYHKKA